MSEKLRKFLVMAAGVLVILETTVISGCRANISGTESDRMVEYTVICGDEIPEEFKKQIMPEAEGNSSSERREKSVS